MSSVYIKFSKLGKIKTIGDITWLSVGGDAYPPEIEFSEPGQVCPETCGGYYSEEEEDMHEFMERMQESIYITPYLSEYMIATDTLFSCQYDAVGLNDGTDQIVMRRGEVEDWPCVIFLISGSNASSNLLLDPSVDDPAAGYTLGSTFLMGSGAESDLLKGKLIDPESALERQLKFASKMELIHCECCEHVIDRQLAEEKYGSFFPRVISSYGLPCGPGSSDDEIKRSLEWTVLNAMFFADQVRAGRVDASPMFMIYGETPAEYLFCLCSILDYIYSIEKGISSHKDFYMFPPIVIGLGGFDDIQKPFEYLRLVETIKAIVPVLEEHKIIVGLFVQGLSSVPAWALISHYIRARLNDDGLILNTDGTVSRNRSGFNLIGSTRMSDHWFGNEPALSMAESSAFCFYHEGGFFDPFSIKAA